MTYGCESECAIPTTPQRHNSQQSVGRRVIEFGTRRRLVVSDDGARIYRDRVLAVWRHWRRQLQPLHVQRRMVMVYNLPTIKCRDRVIDMGDRPRSPDIPIHLQVAVSSGHYGQWTRLSRALVSSPYNPVSDTPAVGLNMIVGRCRRRLGFQVHRCRKLMLLLLLLLECSGRKRMHHSSINQPPTRRPNVRLSETGKHV